MNTLEIIRNAPRVFIIGNGGSYANAMHICNDLLSVGKPAFTLDPSTLTAFSNDYSYDVAFSTWIKIVGEPGDVLIALSGSGKSQNILNAITVAHFKDMEVIKVFGNELSLNMQASEEYQLVWGHDLWRQLKN